MTDYRLKDSFELEVDGEIFEVEIAEIPFREGLELRCTVEGELIRVSDRGLGLHEAKRLLGIEVKRFLDSGS
jgi:hypothetical protein